VGGSALPGYLSLDGQRSVPTSSRNLLEAVSLRLRTFPRSISRSCCTCSRMLNDALLVLPGLGHNSRNRGARSSHGCFVATYRYLSSRLSLVNICTHDRNRCSPSKLVLPSATSSSSFLFSLA
jgi:hypothetical protein